MSDAVGPTSVVSGVQMGVWWTTSMSAFASSACPDHPGRCIERTAYGMDLRRPLDNKADPSCIELLGKGRGGNQLHLCGKVTHVHIIRECAGQGYIPYIT